MRGMKDFAMAVLILITLFASIPLFDSAIIWWTGCIQDWFGRSEPPEKDRRATATDDFSWKKTV
jgi:hypothetical protein